MSDKSVDFSTPLEFPDRNEEETSVTTNTSEAEVDVDNGSEKPDIKKIKNKSFIKRFAIYLPMSIVTLGIWAKFKPLRKNRKGGWGLFAIFVSLIAGVLITKNYFQAEADTLLKDKFGDEAPKVGDLFFFEDGLTNYQELYRSTQNELEELRASYRTLEDKNASIPNMDNYVSISVHQPLVDENQQLKSEIKKLSASVNSIPSMAFVGFEQLDGIVGCTSKYAEAKKQDIYRTQYDGKWVNFDATITKIEDNRVHLKSKDGVNLSVELLEVGSGYDLLVDEKLNITFTLTGLGTCDIPYQGTKGKF